MSFHKYLYLAGEKFKNPHIPAHLDALMKTDFASRAALETIQLERLKKLLTHAKNHTKLYAGYLKDFDIEDMTLEDLKEIPILSKQILLENADDLRNEPEGEALIQSATSGTSGEVFLFNKNIQWDASFRAAQFRGYAWYGVKPWDKSLMFWGFNRSFKEKIKVRIIDFFLNRYRFTDYTNEEYERAAQRVRESTFIAGYSSSIHMMSEYFQKKGYTFDNIKMIKGTSEKIYDSYHKVIREVYGQKMISEYGSAEGGIIAYECKEGGNMHIVMENVIVEEIEGKILITNLWAHSLPFIRFEVGDYIVLDEETECPCGRKHTIIQEVTGRVGKKIHGKTRLFPTLNINHTFKILSYRHGIELIYSAKQYEKGKLVYEVIDDESINKEDTRKKLQDCFDVYFLGDVEMELKFVNYQEGKDKKQKDFESFVKEDDA